MARFHMFHSEEDMHYYKAGEIIFKQGDEGQFLHDVVEGEVALERDGEQLAVLGEGEIFGEVTLINNENHSVTARALSDCKVAQIAKKRFLFMVDEMPNFAISVMRVLAERLKNETAKHH